MSDESAQIFREIEDATSHLGQFVREGLDKTRSDELKQMVRDATELFYRSQEILKQMMLNCAGKSSFDLRSSSELIALQSRLIRTCHLATMVIIYFNSGKMDFISATSKWLPAELKQNF